MRRSVSMPPLYFATALGLAALAGCGSESGDSPTTALGGKSTSLRMEAWCAMEGLSPALRETFIVVDERNLEPAQQGNEFAEKNGAVRDAVISFADPGSALENGRSTARERITLMVASADGSAPRQLFTGCLPGLTQTERTSALQGESSVGRFFSGGKMQELDEAVDTFRATIAGALIQAARSSAPEAAPSEKNPLLASLAATNRIFRKIGTVPRVVLVSDGLPLPAAQDVAAARHEALTEAARTPVDFGNAEVMVIGRGGNDETGLAFIQTYLLRLNGKLASWSADPSGATPTPAPSSLRRYVGTVQYPGSPEGIVRARLAMDSDGKLVNSWLILSGAPYERAIPLTGQGVCNENGDCKLRADNEGFANVWVAARGQQDDVQFDNEAPFGGMREWTLETSGNGLKGEVFDSAVSQVGTVPGQKSIAIQASLDQKANY